MSALRHVIVGGGVAGTEAANAIRRRAPDDDIVIVTREPYPFYSRIRLQEVVDGRATPERLLLRRDSWYREARIDLRLSTAVQEIDLKRARIRLHSSQDEPYDRLLLATGSKPFVPPLVGSELAGVSTMRSMADALWLKTRCEDRPRVVVVGGGLLGLELAATLAALRMPVIVVETAPWLLSRQLDREGGDTLQRLLENRGLSFRLGSGVTHFLGQSAVTGVELSSREVIPASLVLISAGIVPEVGLAQSAGLPIQRGIMVDDHLRTTAECVFAAGDCAAHRGQVYGIWPASEAQGRVAGERMAGEDVAYDGTVRSNSLKVTGIDVFSIGRIDLPADGTEEINRSDGVYRKLVRDRENRLVGAILLGDTTGRRDLTATILGGG